MTYAMIVVNLETEKLEILHCVDNKLKLVETEDDALKYIKKHAKGTQLLLMFPDPSTFIEVLLENVSGKKKSTKRVNRVRTNSETNES